MFRISLLTSPMRLFVIALALLVPAVHAQTSPDSKRPADPKAVPGTTVQEVEMPDPKRVNPSATQAGGAVSEMPFRWTFLDEAVLDVYGVALRPDGDLAALVRVANRTALIVFGADGQKRRKIDLLAAPQNSLMLLAVLPDGSYALGGQCPGARGAYTACVVRTTATGILLPRLSVRAWENVEAMHALPDGGFLLAGTPLSGEGGGCLARIAPAGVVRWQRCYAEMPAIHNVLALGGDSFAVIGTASYRPTRGAVMRVGAAGRPLWTRTLPWTQADSLAVERVIDPTGRETGQLTGGTSDVGAYRLLHDGAGGLLVFASVGRLGAERSLPALFRMDAATGGFRDRTLVPLREAWTQGRMPYGGYRPWGLARHLEVADGGYLVSSRYVDADGSGYTALARIETTGVSHRIWTTPGRLDFLLATPQGIVLAGQRQGRGFIGLVEGRP